MKRLLSSTAALSIALSPLQSWPAMAQSLTDRGAIVAADGAVLCRPTAKKPCDLNEFLPNPDAKKAGEKRATAPQAPKLTAEEKAARKARREARKAAAESSGEVATEAAPDNTAEAPAAKPKKRQKPVAQKTAGQKAADDAALTRARKEITLDAAGAPRDPAAGLKAAPAPVAKPKPVRVRKPRRDEVEILGETLAEPDAFDPNTLGAAVAQRRAQNKRGGSSAEANADPVIPADGSAPLAVESQHAVLGQDDTRSSSEEFTAAPVEVAPGQRSGLSDLEKVGLVALGALAIGAIIKSANGQDDRQVVSNTGDRVVVMNPNGSYSVYKDDDSVLRRPGAAVQSETFADGSTRTIVDRADGSQVITIRDATGRVLRRAVYDATGHERLLIDDMAGETPVETRQLPKPAPQSRVISRQDDDAALRARLAALEVGRIGRGFSLRQVRNTPELRALAATIDAGNVTFDSGASAIRAAQAQALADLGGLMQDFLRENPDEIFLIEGHTDAVGAAAMNLALSDRRAETVALALVEYFKIPPENLVVQGYGESELRINTPFDERQNRRVAVRLITPLLRRAAQ